MFFRESNPRRFRPNFGIYGLEDSLFIPDGTFIYCPLSNSQLIIFRPVDTVNGTFVYCAFDLTNSGFNRTP
jgi:hypothetical protein